MFLVDDDTPCAAPYLCISVSEICAGQFVRVNFAGIKSKRKKKYLNRIHTILMCVCACVWAVNGEIERKFRRERKPHKLPFPLCALLNQRQSNIFIYTHRSTLCTVNPFHFSACFFVVFTCKIELDRRSTRVLRFTISILIFRHRDFCFVCLSLTAPVTTTTATAWWLGCSFFHHTILTFPRIFCCCCYCYAFTLCMRICVCDLAVSLARSFTWFFSSFLWFTIRV